MAGANHWTKADELALLQGVSVYGLAWFQKRTGDSYDDLPDGEPTGRSKAAVKMKILRTCGKGGLTRGAYTLRQVCEATGYSITSVRRAMTALAQKWKRTSLTGSFLIYDDQMVELMDWLKNDYWSKKHRLYNCLWCGTDSRDHHCAGLCKRCFSRYVKRLSRKGLPQQCAKLLETVRRWLSLEPKTSEAILLKEAERQLSKGRVLTELLLVRILRLNYDPS